MRRIYPMFSSPMPRATKVLLLSLAFWCFSEALVLVKADAATRQAQQQQPAQQQPVEDRLDLNDIKAMLGERDTAIAVQNKTIERLLKENAEWKKKAEACSPTDTK